MKRHLYKQILSFFLVILLAFQCLIPVQAVEEVDENVILIETEEDLRQMAENCSLDSWSAGKTFILQKNIQLVKDDFLPIPTFGGVFDGNGNTISGINITDSVSPAGLFGVLQKDSVVKDLKVKGRIAVSGEADSIGGIAGICYGSILNSSFEGFITGESNVGGIVGVNEIQGEIRNCKFNGTVTGDHSVAGISGWNKGILFGCMNAGEINISSEEVEYEIPELSLSAFMNLNNTENTAAHTDVGGVAGFSEGKIYYCINEGIIGYPHVGYNIGGIVGRTKQSYIQNCSNIGTVRGRKDVGGITGQIEPLMEIEYVTDKFQILDRELDIFLDLLEQVYSSVDAMGSKVSGLMKDISYYVNTARVAAGGLSADSEEFYENYNWGMGGMNQGVNDLRDDLDHIEWSRNELPEIPEVDNDHGGEDSVNGENSGEGEHNFSDNIPTENPYEDEIEASQDAVNNFLETTGKHASDINEASREYGEDMKYHMSAINANLEEAGEKLDELAQALNQSGDEIGEDMAAVMKQAQKLRGVISEIRDDMFQTEDVTTQDISDENASKEKVQIGAGNLEQLASEVNYDTDSFQKGKLTRCFNTGKIEADINVGGIVGIMATEYDMDPEDDIEIVGDTSTNVSRTAKVVVRDSRNEGEVIAKKDCVGGIAGKTEIGAIISCESYGMVESMNGDYVGGIVGETSGTVKNCYAKCTLAGNQYVGGIIGSGTEDEDVEKNSMVSNCYSMVDILEGKQYLGAIAGNNTGEFSGNYFVSDTLKGINRINYSQKAEPVEYETVQTKESIVEDFKKLTVKFVVEDEVIKTKEFNFGQTISNLVFPEIPPKEGYYAVWDKKELKELKSDTIVTARYIPYIMSVSSEICRADERPVFFAEGDFKEEDALTVTDKTQEAKQENIKNNNTIIKAENVLEYWVLNIPDNTGMEKYVIHYLKDETYKKVKIYVHENGEWKKVDYEEEGSYYLFQVAGNRAEIIVTK